MPLVRLRIGISRPRRAFGNASFTMSESRVRIAGEGCRKSPF
jgi:hypothetical protein